MPIKKKSSEPNGRRSGRARAKSPEAKDVVRSAFIRAGRKLLAKGDSKECSLRSVARAAGYSPGTIYHYFRDHRALLLAIREQDMLSAVIEFERAAALESDPEARVKSVFLGAVRYWLAHFDQFETLFSLAPSTQIVRNNQGIPFGRSPIVVRSYGVFDKAVRAFLDSIDSKRDRKLAVDGLLAAVHGMIWFPNATRTMDWSNVETMIDAVLSAVLAQWKSDMK